MPLTIPKRSESIMVRLTPLEKDRLVRAAIKNDQRIGQLARRFINEKLSVGDAETDGLRDRHEAA